MGSDEPNGGGELVHSARHRSHLFSVLGERGLKVPNVDYVFFVQSEGAEAR